MNKVMLISGIILISTIFLFFPNYNLPVPKEVYGQAMGQLIIFFTGLINLIFGIFTGETHNDEEIEK